MPILILLHKNEIMKKESQKNKTITNTAIIIAVIPGGGYVLYVIHGNLEDLNLGQKYGQEHKYWSTNESGKSTARGYAFEDLIQKSIKASGGTCKQVAPYKNGPDFVINGTKVQAKYSRTPEGICRNLYDNNGKYRYPGQELWVPAGHKQKVADYCSNKAKQGYGAPQKIHEVDIPTKDIINYSKRGWESFKMDATDPSFTSTIIFGVILCTAATSIVALIAEKINNPEVSNGEVIKIAAKKHGLTCLAAGIATPLIIGFISLIYMQHLRK